MKTILVVDDETGPIESFKAIFWNTYNVLAARSVKEAKELLEDNGVDLLLLDILLPETDGLEFLSEVRALYPDLPVIMVSAMTSTETTAEAIRLGAVEFITKPFNVKDVRTIAERALASVAMRRQLEANRREELHEGPPQTLLGESTVVRNVVEKIRRIAKDEGHCLITGERGSGLESVARMIHSLSSRACSPFISLNCASLPDALVQEELFGRDRSLVAADDVGNEMARLGRLDLASSGTIYLEDVHCLPKKEQKRLLEVMRTGSFSRAGSDQQVKTEARIVLGGPSGTLARGRQEKWDSALYAELKEDAVEIPPLRERKEDVPLLAYSFLNHFRSVGNANISGIDSDAMELMREYSWPGNVKELSNVIEGIVYIHGDEKSIRQDFLPREIHSREMVSAARATGNRTLEEQVDSFQRGLIIDALKQAGGVKKRAARLLGTTSRILNYRIDQLNIETVIK